MKETPKAPAKDTPEPSAMDRMRDFTRRIIAVPKTEVLEKEKPRKPKA